MAIVKIRRVGNSNVITLPAALEGRGFEAGASVFIEAEEDGTLRVIPVPDLDAHVRKVARIAIKRRRRTMEILEAHDRQGPPSPRTPSGGERRSRRPDVKAGT